MIHDAIAFAEKQKIKIVILQPRDIAKAGPELKAKNIPVILGRVLALPDQEDDAYDSAFTQPAEAYKAGVKFAFGTFNNEFVRNLPYQAATAVAFGLPYDEALKAVTINAAEIWGHGNDIGSVEKGKVGRPDGHHRRPAGNPDPGEVPLHQRQGSPAGQQTDPPLRKVHVAPVVREVTSPVPFDRISIDPNICHGQACIKGTRIPVHQIVRMLANNDTVEDLPTNIRLCPARTGILQCRR